MKITADKSYERVARETLTPFQGELKELRVEEYNQLKDSMEREGFFEPVEYWEDKEGQRWIIDGHQRLFVCDKEGWPMPEVPVRPMAAKSKEEAARKLLLLNSRYGRMTGQGLYEYMHEFSIEADELDRFSFSDLDLDSFKLEYFDETTLPPGDEDAIPEVPGDPTSKLGDLWLLGEHRVLCGDCTDAGDVQKVLGGSESIDLCFTSPPYGLGESMKLSGNKSMAANGSPYIGNADSADNWGQLMRDWCAVVFLVVNTAIVNVQPLANNKRELFQWAADNKDSLIDVIVWDKLHAAPQMAKGVVNSQYELLFLYGDPGASRAIPFSTFQGNISSVYCAPPQKHNESADIHGATMPMHLPEWIFGKLCPLAQTIIDPFLGSGTTLIAAEKTGRTCYGTEIAPQYVDVIVKRWQDYTGKDATLDGDGRTFNEIVQSEQKQEDVAAG